MSDHYTDDDRRADLAHHERSAAQIRKALGLPDPRDALLTTAKRFVAWIDAGQPADWLNVVSNTEIAIAAAERGAS